jgi:hypothetical protein
VGEFADELNEQMWSNVGMFDEYGQEVCMKHNYPIENGYYSCHFCIMEEKKKQLNKKEKK